MKASDLGEDKIIEIFQKNFIKTPNIFLGINTKLGRYNDAGAIELDDEKLLIVTTDMIGLKTHIPRIMSSRQIGKKAITVNISDLAAMGAKPLGIVMSVGVPSEFKIISINKIAKGMNEAAQKYGTCIFGGDVNRTDDLILAGTAIGLTTKEKLFTRNYAKTGDIVCVTGSLGNSAAAYYAWKNNLKLSKEIEDILYSSFLEPVARIKESLLLRDLDVVSSCGDISDGLGWELFKTGQASKVGFKIYNDLLPINDSVLYVAKKLKKDPIDMVLYYGEDFELLLTIKKEKWNDISKKINKLDINLIKIGEVCDLRYGNNIIMKNDTKKIIKNVGYDQFFNQ